MKCGAGFNALGIDWFVKSAIFCFSKIRLRKVADTYQNGD